MTQAYPLHWPEGWPRCRADCRRWSLPGGRGNLPGWDRVLDRLTGEIAKIGGRNAVISTDQPPRRDGRPHAPSGGVTDPGVAVYFTRGQQQFVMAQDAYELTIDNLRSLALAIEGLRQMERHGGAHMMERAFAGFSALPPPAGAAAAPLHWRDVLGDVPDGLSASEKLAVLEARYREKAKRAHSDRGGEDSEMIRLNAAIAQARAELRG